MKFNNFLRATKGAIAIAKMAIAKINMPHPIAYKTAMKNGIKSTKAASSTMFTGYRKSLSLAMGLSAIFIGSFGQAATTNRLKLNLPPVGSTTWAPSINSNFQILDSTIVLQGQANTFTSTNTLSGPVFLTNVLPGTGSCLGINSSSQAVIVPCSSGGGSGNGNVLPSPQFQLPYFAVPGTTNTVSGLTGITTDGTLQNLNVAGIVSSPNGVISTLSSSSGTVTLLNSSTGTFSNNLAVGTSPVGNQAIKIDNSGNTGDSYGINATADGIGGGTHYGIYGWGSGATTNYGLFIGSGTARLATPISSLLATNSLGVIVSTVVPAIQNTSTLQSGATFFVSSGTVVGPLSAQSLTLQGTGNFAFFNIPDSTTYQVIGTSITSTPGDAVVWGASNTIIDGGTSGSGLLASNNTWTGTNSFTKAISISSSITTSLPGGQTVFSRTGLLTGSTAQVNIYGSGVVGENLLSIGSPAQTDQVLFPNAAEANLSRYGARLGSISIGDSGTANLIFSHTDTDNFSNYYDATGSMEFETRGAGQDIYFTQASGGEQGRFSGVTGFTVSSSETVKGAGGLGVKFGVIAGSVTASNLVNGQCVQAGANGLLTASGGACGSGGGGSSSLQVTSSGVQITSPTASMNFGSAFTLAAVGSTSTIALNPSSVTLQGQNVINLTSALQSGATFFVSSGTVSGALSANTISAAFSLSSQQINIPNSLNNALASLQNVGGSGLQQVEIFSPQGSGINATPVNGVDLSLNSETIGGAYPLLSTSTLQSGATIYVSSGTISVLNTPTHNVSTLNILNTTNDGQAVLTDPGSSGQNQLSISASNGVGINTSPMPGQDLAVPSETVNTAFKTNGTAVLKTPISINQTNTGVVNSELDFTQNGTIGGYIQSLYYGGTGFNAPLVLNSPLGVSGTAFASMDIDNIYGVSVINSTNNVRAFSVGNSIAGTYNFSISTMGAVAIAGSPGTVGQVLTSGGSNTTPSWATSTGASLSSTQTWTGANTFVSSVTISTYTLVSSSGNTNALDVVALGGNYGTNTPGGAGAEVDCTNTGTNGNCFQIYSHQGTQQQLDAAMSIVLDSNTYNERALYIQQNGTANSPVNGIREDAFDYATLTFEDTKRNANGINGIYQFSDHNDCLRMESRISGSFENAFQVCHDTTGVSVGVNSDYGVPVSTFEIAGNLSVGAGNEGIKAPLNGMQVQGNSVFTSSVTVSSGEIVEGGLQVSSLPFNASGGSADIEIRNTSPIMGLYNAAGTRIGVMTEGNGGNLTIDNEQTTPDTLIEANFTIGVDVNKSGHTSLPHGIDVLGSSSTFRTPVLVSSSMSVVGPIANPYEQTWSTSTISYQIAVATSGVFSVGLSSSPLPTSCGTIPSIIGTNAAFTITPGAGASGCTITFNPPLKNTPTCIVTEQTDSLVNALSYTVTNTALTITQTGFSSKVDAHCFGQNE